MDKNHWGNNTATCKPIDRDSLLDGLIEELKNDSGKLNPIIDPWDIISIDEYLKRQKENNG